MLVWAHQSLSQRLLLFQVQVQARFQQRQLKPKLKDNRSWDVLSIMKMVLAQAVDSGFIYRPVFV